MARRRTIDKHSKEARERKYRLRGGKAVTTRFIPDADSAFAQMARNFARHVEHHAKRFGIEADTIGELTSAVTTFRDALSKAVYGDTAGPRATRLKNHARQEAEAIVRSVARSLRGLPEGTITSVDRIFLNLPERAKRAPERLACPQVAPILKFLGTTDPQKTSPETARHILEYRNDFDYRSTAKPRGSSRMELFVELVPMNEPIPTRPGQRSGGRLWYLRSFTTSRFEVDFPRMYDENDRPVPALVVYWGRWADSKGGTGPFSQTCVAQVENDLRHCLPGQGFALRLPEEADRRVMQITQVRGYIEAQPADDGQAVVLMEHRALPEHAPSALHCCSQPTAH